MTKHFFDHTLAKVCFYKFGTGSKAVLCFHGLGMHGRQFHCLERELGKEFTFFGFDLFFHQETALNDNSLENIQNGLKPQALTSLITDFCISQGIDKFSLLSYSMGTFYAAVLLEQMPQYIERSFFVAPSFLKIQSILKFLSKNKLGNLLFRKLALSERGMYNLVQFAKTIRVLDDQSAVILWKEIATTTMRFNLYATITYLKHLTVPIESLSDTANAYNIPLYFIFGSKDKTVAASLATMVSERFSTAKVYVANEGHDLVNSKLTKEMLFCEQ